MSFFFRCGSADDIIEHPVAPPTKSKSNDTADAISDYEETMSGKASTNGGRKKTPPKRRKKKSFHGSDDPISSTSDEEPVR